MHFVYLDPNSLLASMMDTVLDLANCTWAFASANSSRWVVCDFLICASNLQRERERERETEREKERERKKR